MASRKEGEFCVSVREDLLEEPDTPSAGLELAFSVDRVSDLVKRRDDGGMAGVDGDGGSVRVEVIRISVLHGDIKPVASSEVGGKTGEAVGFRGRIEFFPPAEVVGFPFSDTVDGRLFEGDLVVEDLFGGRVMDGGREEAHAVPR